MRLVVKLRLVEQEQINLTRLLQKISVLSKKLEFCSLDCFPGGGLRSGGSGTGTSSSHNSSPTKVINLETMKEMEIASF